MITLLMKLAQLAPVISLLVVAVIYFLKREKKYSIQISSLHKELREQDKSNLTALLKVTTVLDKVLDNSKVETDKIINDITEMRKSIEEKLNNLK